MKHKKKSWFLIFLLLTFHMRAPFSPPGPLAADTVPESGSFFDFGFSWLKSTSTRVVTYYLYYLIARELWGAKGKSWLDKIGAFLSRSTFKKLHHLALLSEGMDKRLDLLLWLWSETSSPELKALIKENLALLEELSLKSGDKKEQQVFLASIKLRLLRFKNETAWPQNLKIFILDQLEKIMSKRIMHEEQVLCLLTKGYEACSKVVVDKLSFLLGRQPIIVDCSLLCENDLSSPSAGEKFLHRPSIFTKLYLQRKPGLNFLLFKNLEALGSGRKLKLLKNFLQTRQSLVDPCIGDSLDFSQDFIVLTCNDTSYLEVNGKECLQSFAFDKEIMSEFIYFLRAHYLQEQLPLQGRCFTPDECSRFLKFYQEHCQYKSFERYCQRFFSLCNASNGDVAAVFAELLRKKQAKCDISNLAVLPIKKLIKLRLPNYITDQELLRLASKGQEELRSLQASSHPATSEVAIHLRKILQVAQLKKQVNLSVPPELNLQKVREQLDASHFGLAQLKKEILNFVATFIASQDNAKRSRILLLVGPPGTGKTTIAKTLAQALGKEFTKISCGGIVQQCQLKGWPRSYQQAQESLLIQALLQSKSLQTVLLLDEVDKMILGSKEELCIPLLEILDPEQNKRVLDHYLEFFFDYSAVFFILTANTLQGLPPAFLDRCYVINIAPYSAAEKLQIAKTFLLPKIIATLRPEVAKKFSFPKALLENLVATDKEAGVRKLFMNIEAAVGSMLQEYLLVGRWPER